MDASSALQAETKLNPPFLQYLRVDSTNAQTECTNTFGDLAIRPIAENVRLNSLTCAMCNIKSALLPCKELLALYTQSRNSPRLDHQHGLEAISLVYRPIASAPILNRVLALS
uniref:Uncharacterized protein n=1 Tax=Ananas comosus var. bracteatus TaxID=296719 RepID=A0A6V7Q9C9_ANACO|nr:unnamed protein product [Ananas comosus var. bracteatus]